MLPATAHFDSQFCLAPSCCALLIKLQEAHSGGSTDSWWWGSGGRPQAGRVTAANSAVLLLNPLPTPLLAEGGVGGEGVGQVVGVVTVADSAAHLTPLF